MLEFFPLSLKTERHPTSSMLTIVKLLIFYLILYYDTVVIIANANNDS